MRILRARGRCFADHRQMDRLLAERVNTLRKRFYTNRKSMSAASQPTEEPTPRGKEASPIRLAVFKISGEQKEHLATLTLKKGNSNAWTIAAGGPSVEELAPLLQQFSATPRAGPSASPADALSQLLTSEGFSVDRLPDGDHQI